MQQKIFIEVKFGQQSVKCQVKQLSIAILDGYGWQLPPRQYILPQVSRIAGFPTFSTANSSRKVITMELITATDATAIVTTVIGYFTENWAALAVLIGFGVGLKLFRSFTNRGLHGKV